MIYKWLLKAPHNLRTLKYYPVPSFLTKNEKSAYSEESQAPSVDFCLWDLLKVFHFRKRMNRRKNKQRKKCWERSISSWRGWSASLCLSLASLGWTRHPCLQRWAGFGCVPRQECYGCWSRRVSCMRLPVSMSSSPPEGKERWKDNEVPNMYCSYVWYCYTENLFILHTLKKKRVNFFFSPICVYYSCNTILYQIVISEFFFFCFVLFI